MYDPKCDALATEWLEDYDLSPHVRSACIRELAQAIQDTIEAQLQDFEQFRREHNQALPSRGKTHVKRSISQKNDTP